MSNAKRPTTHALLIWDMSGSMYSLAEDVRGGFNEYVAGLRASDGRYRLTVTLFDNHIEPLCVAAKLRDVPSLTADNYRPRGTTALLDAIGKTVTQFEAATTFGEDDRVLVVVQTDGHENASTEWSKASIAELIRDREKTGAWTFVYLGAGVDAWSQAGGIGFSAATTVRTRPMHPEWARSLRDQCTAAGVPFFFKQTGTVLARELGIAGKGDDWDTLPDEFRIRDYPREPARV